MSAKMKQAFGFPGIVAVVAVLVALSLLPVGASSPSASAAAQQEEKKEKRLKLEFKDAGWATVFEWLSDQTGLPYASKHAPPLGTFSFSTPGKTYTIEEVTIILNDHLLKKNYVLLRRRNVITLLKVAE